jgi:hypothetical protein
MEKLKRVIIKEELVILTGNFKSAILLNQMIYWSERVNDFDKFIEEEAERTIKDGKTLEIEPSNGWIYKTSEELSEETMIGLSASNMRKYLKELISNGWLDERTNPVHKWDRTMQYRVNIVKIQKDLLELGYNLEGYPFFKIENAISEIEKGDSKTKNHTSKIKNQSKQNRKAIPEITTETTNKDNIFLSDSKEYRLADYLRKYILKNNPTAKVPNDDGIQKWCKTMDLMLRRDKRTMEDIKKHIEFSQTDTFWMANILSPTSLRKQYDKLTMKIKGGSINGQHSFNSQQNKETSKWAGFKPQTIDTTDYDFNDPDIM